MKNSKASSPIDSFIPLIYIYLYKKLVERYPRHIEVDITDIISTNRNMIHKIPSKYDYRIIDDMIKFKLLIKVNRYKCQIVKDNYEKLTKSIDTYWAW